MFVRGSRLLSSLFLLLVLLFATSATLAQDKVGGTVLDLEGKPLSGASVSAILYTENFLTTFEIVEQVESNEKGQFTFQMPEEKANRASTVTLFMAQHADYGAACWFRRDLQNAGVRFSEMTFKLPATAAVKGVVVAENGTPIQGAEIAAFMSLQRPTKSAIEIIWESRVLFKAKTDAQGRFVLTGLPKDSLAALRIRHPNFAPQLFGLQSDAETPTGEVKAGGEAVSITMTPGVSLNGTVVLEGSNQGVAKTAVLLRIEQENDWGILLGNFTSETDASGNYSFLHIPEGTVSLSASAEAGTGTLLNVSASAPTSSHELVLHKNIVITGTLIDSATEKPLPGGIIKVRRPDGSGSEEVIAKLDGSFSVSTPPGAVTISAQVANMEPDGSTYAQLTLEVGATPEPLTFKFKKALVFKGRVIDEEGKPVAGAVVERRWGNTTTSTSKEDGSFEIALPNQRFGEYEHIFLQAKHPENETQRGILMQPILSAEEAQGDIVLAPAGSVEGLVTDEEDQPLKGIKVAAVYWSTNSGRHLSNTETDEAGRFVLKDLPPHDQYSIYASGTTHGQSYSERFVLEAAEKMEMEETILYTAEMTIEGMVVDEDGAPMKAVNVYSHGNKTGSRNTKSDDQGKFKLENLVDEQVYVNAYHRVDNKQINGSIRVYAGETDVELVLGENQNSGSSEIVLKQLIDKPAPDLDIASWVHGDAVSFEMLKGKNVLLAFWDADGKDSEALLTTLKDVKGKAGKTLCVILIHKADAKASKLKSLATQKALPFHIALDKSPTEKRFPGKTAENYTIRKLPGIYLIDDTGVVQYQNIDADLLPAALAQMK